MSNILIKDMAMPKACDGCILCFLSSDGRNFFCTRQIGKRFDMSLSNQRQEGCPLVEIPEKHGRIVDLDKVLGWLINEDGSLSITTCAEIDNALKNVPVILEASETSKEQKICGNCKWCHEGHYEEEGANPPYIKRSCLNKYGLTNCFEVYPDDFCSKWEGKLCNKYKGTEYGEQCKKDV